MENDCAQVNKKSYFIVKPYERNDKGNTWAMYKDNHKKTKHQ